MSPALNTPFDSQVHEKLIRNESWPVIAEMGSAEGVSAYQGEYWVPSIQIHTRRPYEELAKLGHSIRQYFGIQDSLLKTDKVNIEKPQDVPIPLHKGRIIERV